MNRSIGGALLAMLLGVFFSILHELLLVLGVLLGQVTTQGMVRLRFIDEIN